MENEEKEMAQQKGNLISFKEYAEARGLSEWGARKGAQKYEEAELKDHIFKVNGKKMLDEFAVSFLDEKAAHTGRGRAIKKPTNELAVPEREALKTFIISLIDAMYSERIDTLTKERDEKASKCEDLTVKNTELEVKNEYLVKEQGKLEEQNAELHKQIEQLKQELDQASKRKGLFGWFRK